jgi:hypothetical protein
VIHHPNRSIRLRGASSQFIPEAEQCPTPRRMPSRRSTPGHDSSPPFRPSAHPRCGLAYPLPRLSALGCLTSFACAGPTMPSADFYGAVREDCSPLSPAGHPADLPWSAVLPSVPRRRMYQVRPVVDGGLRGRVPTRPGCPTPPIRFVSVAPHLRSTRPADPTSR